MGDIRELLQTLELAAQRKLYRAKDFFNPYTKQIEFCDLGLAKRERCLFAGNQTGKTEIGSYEAMCHLTGEYPDWWLGRRFERPTKCWVAGVTGLSTRDIVQKKLMGEPGIPEREGTGMIPKENIIHTTLARGVSNLLDKVIVKHASGGESVLMFKSYEQGRTKWQGDTLDFVWFDEEPDADIYSEGITRLAEGGISYLTFTPLLGMTEVVMGFTQNITPDKGIVYMTLDDVTHFSPEEKAKRIAAMPEHERESRERGLPARGSGAVFKVPLGMIEEIGLDPNTIPKEWVWLWGIDFGIAHPFAAVLIAWDREADVIHIVHAFKMKDGDPLMHARAMRPFGHIKVAWPQDGHQRDKGNLIPLAKQYKEPNGPNLWMMGHHAQFADGSNSTEAGIMEMDERFRTGRLKVAKHLTEWFQEYTNYHRKDGLLVKKHDDLMSATRIAVMARHNATQRRQRPGKGQGGAIARDIDFDLG